MSVSRMTLDGVTFRDLNHNGRLDPFEDPRLTVTDRVNDLLPRLSIDELVGLMFHTVIEAGADGEVLDGPGNISKSATQDVVVGKRMNHFNVHALVSARQAAIWANNVQRLACETPHSIPVTISTDPRHAAAQNAGTSWASTFFSQWPDPMGIGALDDVDLVREYYDIVRREYAAVGIRMALHPTADLATEPRWARQRETFGQDPERAAAFVGAALDGLQGDHLGCTSVAATTKHFPGGGPQLDGEDAHFPYGREQVYPGGRFEDHLKPFVVAIAKRSAAMMPYYGMPVGLTLDGEPVEEVGFAYNRQITTDLLRTKLGFEGIVLSDWELVSDNHVGDQVLPARAWGVESLNPDERMLKLLDAGVDQFGGEECTEILKSLVERGLVTRERLEASARRILTLKFQLGLFDDPFVDVDEAPELVGTPEAMALGLATQSRSVVIATNDGVLPVTRGRAFVVGLDSSLAGRFFDVVDDLQLADVVLARLEAPFEPRDDLFLEAWFRQGSLEFRPGLIYQLRQLAREKPIVVDVMADRPAICTPIAEFASALTITFGVSDLAWLRAVTGEVLPEGKLPIEFASSMDAVRTSRPDVPGDTLNPLFEAGHGLHIDPKA